MNPLDHDAVFTVGVHLLRLIGIIFCNGGKHFFIGHHLRMVFLIKLLHPIGDLTFLERAVSDRCQHAVPVHKAVFLHDSCLIFRLHNFTEEYKRFNTQRANELQGINKQIRETITRKVNSVDELKTQSASLIAKIKKLNNDDLINELETDYNVLCKQIKQTEQEISELNGQIAENDAEIKRNVEQKDFSKMEQSALYKEKLQKAVYHSLSAMRGILEIVFKNGMTRYVLIKKHRNGGTYLLPDTFKGDMERKQIIVPSLRTDKDNPYSAQPMNLRYTFDEFFKAMPVEEYEIPITE